MPDGRVLLVEDDPDQRAIVAGILRRQGYDVTEAAGLAEARAALATGAIDLVLADRRLGDEDGLDLLASLRASEDAPPFVLVTAYGTIGHAVETLRAGAVDYLSKPFEREALLQSVGQALESRRLRTENRRLREQISERDSLLELVGRAPAMQQVYRRIEKVAATDATVLLTGESGTGKELAARALHALSRRASGPFVALNCGAIPEGLIEAELFGAERGAYTGADRLRLGKFEQARGGTLFLDEIGDLPLAMQPRLLRVLQEGAITRLAGSEEVPVDVRIVAATHRDLAAAAADGRFRGDLFHRLDVVSIRMPPLRERREDIPSLVEHLMERSARRHGVSVEPLPPQLLKRFLDHAWPGNVRELANAIERLVLLAEDGQVSADDLPSGLTDAAVGDGGFALPPTGIAWDSHERSMLAQALQLAGGNRRRAARLVGLPYRAFLYRIEKHGLAGDGD